MRHGTRSLVVGSILAALCFGPTAASASSGSCKSAKAKLKNDQRRHAPPGIIKKDQARVRAACKGG
jgi:hypothetical protein